MMLTALLGVLAIPLTAAALAWACTPSASMQLDGVAASGPVATSVPLTASGFPEGGAIEIRWDTIGGPVLASGTGPTLSTAVTIPESAPGDHIILAVGNKPDGSRFDVTSVVYTIPGAAPEAPAQAQAPAAQPKTTKAAQPARKPAASVVPKRSSSTTKSNATAPARGPAPRPAVKAPAPARQSTPAVPSSNPPVVQARNGRAVFGGSVAPATKPKASGRSDSAKRHAAKSTTPRAAAPQRPQTAAQKPAVKSPALVPSVADPQVQPSSPGATLVLGVGLLGIGMVALFGGALVAQARRRRAPVARKRTPKS
jgi:hypothetical protein